MASLVGSRYNFLVPLHGGRALVYNSLSGASAVWEKSDVELYDKVCTRRSEDVSPSTPGLGDLLYGGFLRSDDEDELLLAEAEYEKVRSDPSRLIVTVAPTLTCNFGCDYCFQGSNKPKGRMSSEVQDRLVDFVSAEASRVRHMHVAWYGGEPLLATDIMASLSRRFLRICEDNAVTYDAIIVTNGYRLSEAVAQELRASRVTTVQITLDGTEEEHDQRRHLLHGGGSFGRIMDNLRSVVLQIPLNVSVRINIDSRNAASIGTLLEQLAARGLSHRPNFSVYFAPVEAITEGCHSISDSCLSKTTYAELETTLSRQAFDLGLARAAYPPRFRGICGAIRPNGWVVLPNGDLHRCWDTVNMPEQRVGTIFDVSTLAKDHRVQRWTDWSPFHNEVCRSCKLLPSCSGSCAHKFVNPTHTLGEAAQLPCPSWKYNINERLVARAVQSGMIASDDYDPEDIRTDSRLISPLSHEGRAIAAKRRFLPILQDSQTGCGGCDF